MQHIGIGIDTARYGHRVTFLDERRNPATGPITVMESRDGYSRLQQQLEQLHQRHPQAIMHVHVDAAGSYATNLEVFLRQLPLQLSVSVGQPKRNKDYQQVHFPKRKSDDTESHAMARFAVVEHPQPTAPIAPEFYLLKEVVSRLHSQVKHATRLVNQLHNLLARTFPELATLTGNIASVSVLNLLAKYPVPERIAAARTGSLEKIPYLTKELAKAVRNAASSSVASLRGELAETMVKELVQQVIDAKNTEKRLEKLVEQAFDGLPHAAVKQILTIPGIGKRTAGILAAKIVSIDRFDSPQKLVGYFGFFPEESSSGVDKGGRPLPPGASRMSAKGNDLARAYLWMGAKSAILHNPAVRPLYRRLRAKGKRGDVALGHCARKLLHLVFAIWKTNQPFHPEHYPWAQETESTSQPTPTDAPQSTHAKNATGLKQDDVRAKKEVTVAASNVSSAASRVNGSSQSKPEQPSPSVDYAYLRSQIGFERVLRHLNRWEQLRRNGPELRGPCPLHSPLGSQSRSFAVNPEKHVYQCFGKSCNESGNVLDFWAAYHNLSLHQAALNLSETFQLETTKTEKRSP